VPSTHERVNELFVIIIIIINASGVIYQGEVLGGGIHGSINKGIKHD